MLQILARGCGSQNPRTVGLGVLEEALVGLQESELQTPALGHKTSGGHMSTRALLRAHTGVLHSAQAFPNMRSWQQEVREGGHDDSPHGVPCGHSKGDAQSGDVPKRTRVLPLGTELPLGSNYQERSLEHIQYGGVWATAPPEKLPGYLSWKQSTLDDWGVAFEYVELWRHLERFETEMVGDRY